MRAPTWTSAMLDCEHFLRRTDCVALQADGAGRREPAPFCASAFQLVNDRRRFNWLGHGTFLAFRHAPWRSGRTYPTDAIADIRAAAQIAGIPAAGRPMARLCTGSSDASHAGAEVPAVHD